MKKINVFLLCVVASLALLASCSKSNNEQKIRETISEVAKDCPIVLNEFLTMTNVVIEGKNIVYVYNVNEYYIDDYVSEWDRREMKQAALEYIKYNSDPSTEEVVRMCKECNYNLAFRYIGSYSDYVLDIVVNASEL